MNLLTFQEFRKEAALGGAAESLARGSARFGGKAIGVIKETGGILRDSISPMHLPEGLRRGVKAMTNTARHSRQAMREGIEAAAARGHHYADDFSQGSGMWAKARRAGLLSNTPKYMGSNKLLRARNTMARALPGQMAVNAPMLTLQASSSAKKRDPVTGREKGKGERILGTALGLTTGVVGMRGGMISGAVTGALGDEGGRRLGRLFDQGAHAVRGGAAPAATGVAR